MGYLLYDWPKSILTHSLEKNDIERWGEGEEEEEREDVEEEEEQEGEKEEEW